MLAAVPGHDAVCNLATMTALKRLGGSTTEMLARSERVSNRKSREASGWSPQYPSSREGWRMIAIEMGT